MTNFSGNNVIDQKNVFPAGFLQLVASANIESSTEAFVVLLHTCMLNAGFLPVDIEEQNIYKSLPETWRAKGAWKFQYCHKTCSDVTCWITCVPLYSYLAVHGAVEDFPHDNMYIKFKIPSYVNDQADLSNMENVFIDCKDLMWKFKDVFCFQLLALLQESTGIEPYSGLSNIIEDIKLDILKLLPVQSVVALSRVNKDFNRLTNCNFLWEYLVKRDFGLDERGHNHKEIYKREYMKKKQRPRRYVHRIDPFFHPPFVPRSPSRYIDINRDLDPAIQQAFPHLRDRLRPYWLFNPPYDYS